MRVYLIKHKNYVTSRLSLDAYSRAVQAGQNGFCVLAVHAFLRRKDAEAYLKELPETIRKYRKIVPFEEA